MVELRFEPRWIYYSAKVIATILCGLPDTHSFHFWFQPLNFFQEEATAPPYISSRGSDGTHLTMDFRYKQNLGQSTASLLTQLLTLVIGLWGEWIDENQPWKLCWFYREVGPFFSLKSWSCWSVFANVRRSWLRVQPRESKTKQIPNTI